MARLTVFIWSVAVVSLLCVQLGASLDVARLCERRCLYGRGGILCQCNAMHFKGKRSRPTAHGLRSFLYRFDPQQDLSPGKVKFPAAEDKSKSSSFSFLSSSTSGSEISRGENRDPKTLAVPLETSWDADRAKLLLQGLRTLAHQDRKADKENGFIEPATDEFRRHYFSSQSFYPMKTWGVFENQDQLDQKKSELDRLQPHESQQNVRVKPFEYSAASRDVYSNNRNGFFQSGVQIHPENRSDKDGVSGSQARDNISPSFSAHQFQHLQEVLRQALHGR